MLLLPGLLFQGGSGGQHVHGLGGLQEHGVRGTSCLAGYLLVSGKSEVGETERSLGGHTREPDPYGLIKRPQIGEECAV